MQNRNLLTITITIFLFIIQTGISGQVKNNPAHLISFEGGMWNRGIVGMSYHRLFIQQELFILGAGAGLGIGGEPFGGGINQFYYLTVLTGIGFNDKETQFYLSPGLDIKYTNFFLENTMHF